MLPLSTKRGTSRSPILPLRYDLYVGRTFSTDPITLILANILNSDSWAFLSNFDLLPGVLSELAVSVGETPETGLPGRLTESLGRGLLIPSATPSFPALVRFRRREFAIPSDYSVRSLLLFLRRSRLLFAFQGDGTGVGSSYFLRALSLLLLPSVSHYPAFLLLFLSSFARSRVRSKGSGGNRFRGRN